MAADRPIMSITIFESGCCILPPTTHLVIQAHEIDSLGFLRAAYSRSEAAFAARPFLRSGSHCSSTLMTSRRGRDIGFSRSVRVRIQIEAVVVGNDDVVGVVDRLVGIKPALVPEGVGMRGLQHRATV